MLPAVLVTANPYCLHVLQKYKMRELAVQELGLGPAQR